MANSFNTIVGVGSRLGNFQTACDVIGMTEVPVVSQAADIISCGISLATGDYVGAALSVGSLIPGLGQATGAAKLARGSVKVVGKAQDIAKSGKPFDSVTLQGKGEDLFDVPDTVKKRDDYHFINNKGKSEDLSNVPEKTSVAKKNETGANSAKEESHKEIEDVPVQSIQPEVSSKLDTGSTNPLEGVNLSDTIRPRVNREVQSSNYAEYYKRIEYGKQFNNPTGGMPKTNLW